MHHQNLLNTVHSMKLGCNLLIVCCNCLKCCCQEKKQQSDTPVCPPPLSLLVLRHWSTHTLSHTLAHTHFSKLMSPRYPVCKSLLLFLFLHHNTRSKTPPPSNSNSILLKSDSEPTGAGPPHVDPSDEVKSSITFSALAS